MIILLCIILVGLLLLAEAQGQPILRATTKTLAALCFVLVGLTAGGLESGPGQMIVAGLALSALGDVLLLSRREPVFLVGMGAFGAAHLAYAAGFWMAGPIPLGSLGLGLLVSGLGCAAALAWLRRDLPRRWQLPVLIYGVVIGMMVALGLAGGVAGTLPPILTIAAVAFAVSDVSVAQDRLITPAFRLRLWGLPLYFAAQMMFAVGAGRLS